LILKRRVINNNSKYQNRNNHTIEDKEASLAQKKAKPKFGFAEKVAIVSNHPITLINA
jgi:hypothetical protein